MPTYLELAALPPAAKLCLETADRCSGLIKTEGGYIGRMHHPRDPGTAYTAQAVAPLLAYGLARVHDLDEDRIDLTDAGMLMQVFGRVRVATA